MVKSCLKSIRASAFTLTGLHILAVLLGMVVFSSIDWQRPQLVLLFLALIKALSLTISFSQRNLGPEIPLREAIIFAINDFIEVFIEVVLWLSILVGLFHLTYETALYLLTAYRVVQLALCIISMYHAVYNANCRNENSK